MDEHTPLVDLGNERPQVPARARIMSPIVPRASISGRALVAVVAIMTFLASITTGAVLLVSASAAEWQSDVASEITIQVRPLTGRDIEREVDPVEGALGERRIVDGGRDRVPHRRTDHGRQLRAPRQRRHVQSFSRSQISFAARNAFSVSANV